MKIFVRFGHDYLTNGACTAARGILLEYEVIKAYAPYIVEVLKQAGHEVRTGGHTKGIYTTSSKALIGEVNKAKNWGAQLFISCHANAGGGTGPEVFYRPYKSLATNLALKISADVSSLLGLRNRGAKNGSQYYETKTTTFAIPSIIIEPFFVDNPKDCNVFNSIGGAKLGTTIANSILSIIPK